MSNKEGNKEGSNGYFLEHLHKPPNRKTQDTKTISLNTFTYLLIILLKSLTKASEELWPTPHRCSFVAVISFSCFRSSIRESIVGRLC